MNYVAYFVILVAPWAAVWAVKATMQDPRTKAGIKRGTTTK
jgi:hypothetical protein